MHRSVVYFNVSGTSKHLHCCVSSKEKDKHYLENLIDAMSMSSQPPPPKNEKEPIAIVLNCIQNGREVGLVHVCVCDHRWYDIVIPRKTESKGHYD